jgi:hypothetical protein
MLVISMRYREVRVEQPWSICDVTSENFTKEFLPSEMHYRWQGDIRYYTFQQNLRMKSTTFWDITSCSPLSVSRCFGGTYRLHLKGRKNKLIWVWTDVSEEHIASILRVEEISLFECEPTFRRNMSPPSLGPKNKPSKKPAELYLLPASRRFLAWLILRP